VRRLRRAATFLDLERDSWLRRTVDALVTIYSIAFEGEAEIINNPPAAAAQLWLEIARRVEALGGLSVRRADWASTKYLAVHTAHGMHRMYAS
jgi:hypothetical protein